MGGQCNVIQIGGYERDTVDLWIAAAIGCNAVARIPQGAQMTSQLMR